MRAKAIRTYTDKCTMESIEIGSIINTTLERFEEINSTSLGRFLEAEENTEDVEKGMKEESANKKVKK